MNHSNGLDPAALERLHKIGGAILAADMLAIYLDYAPARFAEVRAAVPQGDLPAVEKSAHALKSAANHVGASAVFDLARQLEGLARSKTAELIPEMVEELGAAMEEVRPRIESALREARP
ncbi:MAG: Hpt domain-containing protein [Verrucomicrobia bacterium]|nr:Hpt domain-containing protein [Verrucomicrobiota bacterium]